MERAGYDEDIHCGDVRTNKDSTERRGNVLGHGPEVKKQEVGEREGGWPRQSDSHQAPAGVTVDICGFSASLSRTIEQEASYRSFWIRRLWTSERSNES